MYIGEFEEKGVRCQNETVGMGLWTGVVENTASAK